MNFKPDRSAYTPIDLIEWRESGTLSLTPKFQRRSVWTTPARSFLIDTLIQGMPVPPIYIRVVQSAKRDKAIREVIDGQQRIAAVLDFIDGKYSLSKNVDTKYAGCSFASLPEKEQQSIRQYSFICEVFHGIEDKHVLSIFARLNTHSVKLNSQELRNGRYFGYFKRLAYSLALDHLEFWKRHGIFSDSRIARMAEVEMTSELLVAGLAGLQDKKTSLDSFYEDLDETFPAQQKMRTRFERAIDAIEEACGEFLNESEFRRAPIFYTLYSAVYHHMFGLPQCSIPSPKRGKMTKEECEALGTATRDLSEVLRRVRVEDDFEVPARLKSFVTSCLRQTDNIKPRRTRLETLYSRAFS